VKLGEYVLQLGVGGAFAVIVIAVVLTIVFKRVGRGGKNHTPCIYTEDAKKALERNLLSHDSQKRQEKTLERIKDHGLEQTTVLREIKTIFTQNAEQTKHLPEIKKVLDDMKEELSNNAKA
jgi:hypothetical protein